jgi:uncharacterized glyoxalase superfamily protein PhnB
MALLALSPMLETHDMKSTVEFYTQTLGFICTTESQEWSSFSNGDITIMFSIPNEHMGHGRSVMSGSLYFRVDNVDELWTKLKDTYKVCYEIENFEYGMREFAIFDNNGYVLQFGQIL